MYRMEVEKILSHSQYALPVGGVLILAILVFVFGFKTVAEPTFDRTAGEEKKKKQIAKVKPKPKKGPLSNGSASPETQVESKKSSAPTQPISPAKVAAKKESPKKSAKVEPKSVEEVVTRSNKKNVEVKEPKPADFDDGNWVPAAKKKDRKKKGTDVTPANGSPATSPTHQVAKKADKKKIKEAAKKEEMPKSNETVVVEKEDVAVAPVVVEKAPEPVVVPREEPVKAKEVAKEKKPAEEAPKVEVKKEKNNNNAKPKKVEKVETKSVEEKVVETIEPAVEEESGDPWQENKAAKKKKKVRRD